MLEIRSKSISIVIFFAVGLISLLSFNQILFPKLLIELTSVYPSSENIFELGIWAIPFLIFNISFLVLVYIKFFKISIRKYIPKIFDFDISKRITILSLIVIFTIYFSFSINGLDDLVSDSGDLVGVIQNLEDFDFIEDATLLNDRYLRYVFLTISNELFGNLNILPLISSASLMFLTYLFSVKLSGKRISGIIALIILSQSYLFHLFDTTATYDTFWVFFFILALYLILKRPYISPVSFIASIFTKPVTFLFFPIIISLILSVSKPMINKKKILAVYCFFPILFIMIYFVSGGDASERFVTIDTRNLLTGFNSLSMGLRNDGLILSLFFPTLFLLINKSLNHFRYANFLLISITMMMLISPLISGVADLTTQPYRLIPFITMFSISFGYLFSKKN